VKRSRRFRITTLPSNLNSTWPRFVGKSWAAPVAAGSFAAVCRRSRSPSVDEVPVTSVPPRTIPPSKCIRHHEESAEFVSPGVGRPSPSRGPPRRPRPANGDRQYLKEKVPRCCTSPERRGSTSRRRKTFSMRVKGNLKPRPVGRGRPFQTTDHLRYFTAQVTTYLNVPSRTLRVILRPAGDGAQSS